ncbi:MAG TPA: hypothetical protein PKW95_21270 [bacterium]|nr:hypothetical protein [bacterium]
MKAISRVCVFLLLVAFVAFACGDDDDDDNDNDSVDDDATDDDDSTDDDATDDDDDDDDNPLLHPEAPGPYVVGNRSFFFTDESRELSCGDGPRSLLVEIWYPAADDADQGAQNTIEDFFLGRLDEVLELIGAQGEMENLPTGSYRDAPLHPQAQALPVIVFSHGFMSNRFQNFTMAAYLASHGYVIVAPDHICNAMVTLTPDAAVAGSPLSMFSTIRERTGDIDFLLALLRESPPEFLAGRLDLTRSALWGHSWGGLTVSESIKDHPEVGALLQMASFGTPVVPETITASSMYFWGKQEKVVRMFTDWHYAYLAAMPPPKFSLEFFDTGHFAFSDLCRFVPVIANFANGCGTERRVDGQGGFTNPDHEALHAVLDAYATAFFGAALYDLPELTAYLNENHWPEMMEYAVTLP